MRRSSSGAALPLGGVDKDVLIPPRKGGWRMVGPHTSHFVRTSFFAPPLLTSLRVATHQIIEEALPTHGCPHFILRNRIVSLDQNHPARLTLSHHSDKARGYEFSRKAATRHCITARERLTLASEVSARRAQQRMDQGAPNHLRRPVFRGRSHCSREGLSRLRQSGRQLSWNGSVPPARRLNAC